MYGKLQHFLEGNCNYHKPPFEITKYYTIKTQTMNGDLASKKINELLTFNFFTNE